MANEKTPAVLTHVLGIFTLFVGPLAMYFVFRRKASPWLRAHLDESVNYHILVLATFVFLVSMALVATSFNLSTVALLLFGLAFLVFLASVVFGVIAVLKASKGQAYHFPLDVKIIR